MGSACTAPRTRSRDFYFGVEKWYFVHSSLDAFQQLSLCSVFDRSRSVRLIPLSSTTTKHPKKYPQLSIPSIEGAGYLKQLEIRTYHTFGHTPNRGDSFGLENKARGAENVSAPPP